MADATMAHWLNCCVVLYVVEVLFLGGRGRFSAGYKIIKKASVRTRVCRTRPVRGAHLFGAFYESMPAAGHFFMSWNHAHHFEWTLVIMFWCAIRRYVVKFNHQIVSYDGVKCFQRLLQWRTLKVFLLLFTGSFLFNFLFKLRVTLVRELHFAALSQQCEL